jgi:carbon-monoxide dehydrogenase small subunit
MEENITFTLNNEPVALRIDGSRTLLWVIRTVLEKTGTKYGCGIGYCGSCTVLLDGEAVRSCHLSVAEVKGKRVTTIEGLEDDEGLHPVQKAFIHHDSLQCGFCTPGMIMNAVGLLKANPNPSREEVVAGMNENLCRCGSYNRIVDAVLTAANEINGGV